MQRTLTTLLVVATLVVTPMSAAAAQQPRFETYVPEPTLQPGGVNQVTITLVNDAKDPDDRVETARNVHATVRSGDTPFDVKSGTRLLGDMPDGQPTSFSVRLSVPATTPGRIYDVPIRVEYTNQDGDRVRKRVHATVRVEERPRFVVAATESSVPVGGRGTVSVTVTNVGERPATDASLVLESTSPAIRFGGSATASRFVGNWTAGETRTLTYQATAAETAEPGNYSVTGRVTYEDTDGNDAASRSLPLGLALSPEQSFSVRNVSSTLRVGGEGELRGTIVNDGPTAIENAVVVFRPSTPSVTAIETEVAVGSLAPGETASFAFDASVTDAATAGPKQFGLSVRYRRDDVQYRSDTLDVRVDVGTYRPIFGVEPVNATLSVGSSGQLTLRVTNTGERPVSDVSAKIYTETPLSSTDDEAFVERLAPGETARLTFGVGVGSGAIPRKTYPVTLDVRYDDAEGDTHISDTYQVPLQVSDSDRQGLPLPLVGGVVALLAALVGGWYYHTRR